MATQRHRKPENYLSACARNGHGMSESRPLAASEQASEALMMGLRLEEGVDLAQMAHRFGLPGEELIDADKARFYRGLGMIERDGPRLRVAPQGMVLLDALLGELVSAELLAAT